MARAVDTGTAAQYLPERLSLTSLRESVDGCQACPLWRTATQAVFGEGAKRSEVMLVGEQPGDREDREGRPFVGPAGRLLDAELAVVKPEVLVCLGATAAQALLGRSFRVTRERGQPVDSDLAPHVLATIHPSAILRADPETRESERAAFVDDLKVAASMLRA